MSIFPAPITSAFGQHVKADAGAKMFFFEVGTTTPKITFADQDETTPQTSPVLADGDGRFPAIFLTGAYDVVLKDANSVQVWKVLDLTGSGVPNAVICRGGFDVSTNAGDYPATGSKGDQYVVSTGFILNPDSGSHELETRDFILANTDNALGVDADWDIIRGVTAASDAAVVVRPWATGQVILIGNYREGSDNKIYASKTNHTAAPGNDPALIVTPSVDWDPFGDLIDDAVTDDDSRGATASVAKSLQDQIDAPAPATTTTRGADFIFKRCVLSRSLVDLDHSINFSSCAYHFFDGTGSTASSGGGVKELDNTWTAGTQVGGLADALTIAADTWYHCFGLSNADGSSRDFGFDTDPLAVNLLADTNVIAAGYTKFQRFGSIQTNGVANVSPFFQRGKRFNWVTRRTDVFATGAIGTGAIVPTMSTPLGVVVIGIFDIMLLSASSDVSILVTSLEETNSAPTLGGDFTTLTSIFSNDFAAIQVQVETDLFSQIRYRVSTSLITEARINALAWIDEDLE